MEKYKKRKRFIAVVLMLAMMFSMNIVVFAGSAAMGYTVDFYYGDVKKTTATLTYNAIGARLPECSADGWRFETYLVSDKDGTETLLEAFSYTSSADNNVVTQELMDMLSCSKDAGSVGYTLQYKAFTNRGSAAKAPDSVATKIAMSSATKAKINWNKSANADGYVIYRATSKNGTYKKVADVKADAVSYTDSGLTYGKTYYYKVKAYCKNGDETLYSEDSSVISVKLTLGKTTISSVANSSSGVELKWSKVSGATGYYVYRKADSGSYSKIKTISSGNTVSYTDKSANNGTKYTYKVVAYYGKNTGSYNTKTIVRLTRPTISSAKNSSSKAIAVKWNKNTKATGYQVKYVTGSTTKTVTVSKNSTVSYTIKKLTKGKTYKVYVRSYKTVSGTKYYSAWSSAKSVKISK